MRRQNVSKGFEETAPKLSVVGEDVRDVVGVVNIRFYPAIGDDTDSFEQTNCAKQLTLAEFRNLDVEFRLLEFDSDVAVANKKLRDVARLR